jgi:hypothetical protein
VAELAKDISNLADMFSLIIVFQDATDHGLFPARRNPAIVSVSVNFVNQWKDMAKNPHQEKDTEVIKMILQLRFVSRAE